MLSGSSMSDAACAGSMPSDAAGTVRDAIASVRSAWLGERVVALATSRRAPSSVERDRLAVSPMT